MSADLSRLQRLLAAYSICGYEDQGATSEAITELLTLAANAEAELAAARRVVGRARAHLEAIQSAERPAVWMPRYHDPEKALGDALAEYDAAEKRP